MMLKRGDFRWEASLCECATRRMPSQVFETTCYVIRGFDTVCNSTSAWRYDMRLRVKIRVFALVAIVAPLLGATPEDNFEKLYGDQAKRVQVSRDPKKIEEFAEGLIKDAGELKLSLIHI